MADDGSWAPVARSSREALRLLGYDIGAFCLPDEPEACGGGFSTHAAAHLATLQAVADHQLAHLGPRFQKIAADTRAAAAGTLTCRQLNHEVSLCQVLRQPPGPSLVLRAVST